MEEPVEENGDHDRSLFPMARFAAADPQVTGVLQDIVQSLRGLKRRMGTPKGRLGTAPAPDEGVVVAVSTSAPGTAKTKRKKKKKGKTAAEHRIPDTPRPSKAAVPKMTAPSTRDP